MEEKLINLLPEEEKEILRIEEKTGAVIRLGITLIAVLLIAAGVLAGIHQAIAIFEKSEGDLLQTEKGRTEGLELRELGKEIRISEALLKRAQTFRAQPLPWVDVLGNISQAVPATVYLKNLSLDSAGQLSVSGFAPTRDDVALAEKALEGIPGAKNVTERLQAFRNVEPERDITFSFELILKPSP